MTVTSIRDLWKAASAVGIPDRSDYGDVTTIPKGVLLDYIRQLHKARRAGTHEDIRFGNDDTGLYSWASRKGMPKPGQKVLAVQQPLHAPSYAAFTGEIQDGYGAGTVSRKDKGKVIVTKATPGQLSFVVAHKKHPELYTMVRKDDGKNWMLLNHTPMNAKAYAGDALEKPHYKLKNWADVEHNLGDYTAQPKADGASQLFRLNKDNVDAFSYRTAKDGRPLIHSQRIFHNGGSAVSIPKDLVGTIVRGELLGFKGEQEKAASVIPPQELGGLLNSSLAKSIEDQKSRNIELKAMLYDIVGHKGSHAERRERLAHVVEALGPRFFLPEEAEDPESIRELQQRIAEGKHPLTSEGVMLYPKGGGDPIKVKNTDEHDVVIRSLFAGKKKYEGSHSGGFAYSMDPDGPIVGEVGSGLSDETRAAMHERPTDYIGRTARVRAAKQMPSGALYSPVFLALHEDIPQMTIKKASAFDGIYNRILSREGGHSKITRDTGGVTKGGIAESSGMSAQAIRALTPQGIRKQWEQRWNSTGGKLTNPGTGEVYFDMAGNIGPGQAAKYLQRSVNGLLPAGQRIAEDGVFGAGTVAAANQVSQSALTKRLHAAFRKHHADVATNRPTTHGKYLNGWNNRTDALAKSPLVAPLMQPAVKVKGTLHEPVLIKRPTTPPPNSIVVPTPQPQDMAKAGGMTKGAVLGFKALTGHTAPIKAFLKHLKSQGIPIRRVRPANPAAQLPNTAHLPVGSSEHHFSKNYPGMRQTSGLPYNSSHLDVGKGRPRVSLIPDGAGGFIQKPGVAGGSAPSPIGSMFHEGGHALHQRAVQDLARTQPGRFGGSPHWSTTEQGLHYIPNQPKLSTMVDELGANNAALQSMKQLGATDEAMNYYKAVRQNSFNTYTAGLPDSPITRQLMQLGGKGYTPGYKGLDQFYKAGAQVAAQGTDHIKDDRGRPMITQSLPARLGSDAVAWASRRPILNNIVSQHPQPVRVQGLDAAVGISDKEILDNQKTWQRTMDASRSPLLQRVEGRPDMPWVYSATGLRRQIHNQITDDDLAHANPGGSVSNFTSNFRPPKNYNIGVIPGMIPDGAHADAPSRSVRVGYASADGNITKQLRSAGVTAKDSRIAHAIPGSILAHESEHATQDEARALDLKSKWFFDLTGRGDDHRRRALAEMEAPAVMREVASTLQSVGDARPSRLDEIHVPAGPVKAVGLQGGGLTGRDYLRWYSENVRDAPGRRNMTGALGSPEGAKLLEGPFGQPTLYDKRTQTIENLKKWWNPAYKGPKPPAADLGQPAGWRTASYAKGQINKSASIASLVQKARKATDTNPTPGMIEAGNYAKGTLNFHGLTVKLENPKGSTRSGVDDSGKAWSNTMKADYGYFKDSKAADGDAVDCFIGPDTTSQFVVAIDQYKGDTFDETKFVMGVTTQEQGEKLYLSHYPKGWKFGPVSTTTTGQLKTWLSEGKTKKPFKGQMVKAASRWSQSVAAIKSLAGEAYLPSASRADLVRSIRARLSGNATPPPLSRLYDELQAPTVSLDELMKVRGSLWRGLKIEGKPPGARPFSTHQGGQVGEFAHASTTPRPEHGTDVMLEFAPHKSQLYSSLGYIQKIPLLPPGRLRRNLLKQLVRDPEATTLPETLVTAERNPLRGAFVRSAEAGSPYANPSSVMFKGVAPENSKGLTHTLRNLLQPMEPAPAKLSFFPQDLTPRNKRFLEAHPAADTLAGRRLTKAFDKSAACGDAGWQKRAARAKIENEAVDRAVDSMPDGPDKDAANKGHGTMTGSCGHRIRGCRCRSGSHDIKLTLDIECEACAEEHTKAASLSDWMRGEDDNSPDWRWGLLGPKLAGGPSAVAANLNAAIMMANPPGLDDLPFEAKMMDKAREAGANVVKADDYRLKPQGILQKWLVKHFPQAAIPQGTAYNPADATIITHDAQRGAGHMAHELGHHQGGKTLMHLNTKGKGALGLMAALAGLAPDEDKSAIAAGLGTLAGGGMLTSEVDASRRGYQLMRSVGSGRKGALRAFAGLPSYIAAAAVPAATFGLKKHMGGFDHGAKPN